MFIKIPQQTFTRQLLGARHTTTKEVMTIQTLPNPQLSGYADDPISLPALALPPIEQAFDHVTLAKQLWEQGNQLLIKAGEELQKAKDLAKRKFGKLLEGEELAKAQANKLIKAAEVVEELYDDAAPRLGLPILLQLGQPKNREALQALSTAPDANQLIAAETIKEKRIPLTPKPKPVVEWGKNKHGDRQLILRLPDGDIALDFETGYKQSGLPLQLYLSQLLKGTQEPDYLQSVEEALNQVFDETHQGAIVCNKLAESNEQSVTQEQQIAFEEEIADALSLRRQTQTYLETNNDKSVFVQDEQSLAQAELERYLTEQVETIEGDKSLNSVVCAAADLVNSTPIQNLCALTVGSSVAHSDPYDVKHGYHGTVEEIRDNEFLVYWKEREGRPGSPRDWYEVGQLRLINHTPDSRSLML